MAEKKTERQVQLGEASGKEPELRGGNGRTCSKTKLFGKGSLPRAKHLLRVTFLCGFFPKNVSGITLHRAAEITP